MPGTQCQWHSLLPIDCFWGHGNGYADWLPGDLYHFLDPKLTAAPMELPMYSDDELAGFLNNCLSVGGAVTLNVGIYLEGYLGARNCPAACADQSKSSTLWLIRPEQERTYPSLFS